MAKAKAKSGVGEKIDHIDKRLKAVVGVIVSLITLGGMVVGAVKWGVSPITDSLGNLEQSSTRTELLLLINNYPDDKRAIEELAYHYFAELQGDSYVYGIYSNWAEAHGVNYSNIRDIHSLNK